MMLLRLGWAATPSNKRGQGESQPVGLLAYGITDRIAYLAPLLLEVALLDDSPPDGSAAAPDASRAPVSLVVHGGLGGFGYSSTESLLVYPNLGFGISRRIGSRFRLGVGSFWAGVYKSQGRDAARFTASVRSLAQLGERVAGFIRVFDAWETEGLAPSSRWTQHVFGGEVGILYRPSHWLTLGASAWLEVLWFPPASGTVADPFGPLPAPGSPNRRAVWGAVWANLHW